jgi:hypothetical protein
VVSRLELLPRIGFEGVENWGEMGVMSGKEEMWNILSYVGLINVLGRCSREVFACRRTAEKGLDTSL